MAFLTAGTIRRVLTSLSSQKSGNEVLGALGQYGGFRVNGSGIVTVSTGDITAIADSGGAVGTYRVLFPNINNGIQSIDWFEVAGFTPVPQRELKPVKREFAVTTKMLLLNSGTSRFKSC